MRILLGLVNCGRADASRPLLPLLLLLPLPHVRCCSSLSCYLISTFVGVKNTIFGFRRFGAASASDSSVVGGRPDDPRPPRPRLAPRPHLPTELPRSTLTCRTSTASSWVSNTSGSTCACWSASLAPFHGDATCDATAMLHHQVLGGECLLSLGLAGMSH